MVDESRRGNAPYASLTHVTGHVSFSKRRILLAAESSARRSLAGQSSSTRRPVHQTERTPLLALMSLGYVAFHRRRRYEARQG